MKKRKFLLGLSVLLLTILAGCGADSELTDVSQDIQTEINKDYSSELSEMNIMDIISVESDEEQQLSAQFSGTLYIMATKEDLQKLSSDVDFALNDIPFTAVKENSDDDFNIRYNNKTYFSVKKIDVTDIDKVKITSDWSKKIIVALRNA
ncbi:hypothetical protein [Streptococcus pasteurianus]|uniref:hypothetical protein n=1 Tax=Streptococcus pasteurianus TaxID=197614 RepID=UPI0022E56790|nr:hypothetical protein [Streptococcus pasteurianus]